MNLEELQRFCMRPDDECFYKEIAAPWTFREWTYATDARIILRVPAIAKVRTQQAIKVRISAVDLFKRYYSERLPFYPLSLPARPKADRLRQLVVPLVHRIVNWRYLEQIFALPRVRVAVHTGSAADPLAFRFSGGVGLLMPMQTIEEEKAA